MSIYINRLNDFTDKFLFIIFALSGGFIIWIGRSTGFATAYVYGFVILLMAAYGVYCYLSPYFKIRAEKAGDNIYYLGFIFTLVSLGVSLYQTALGGSSEEVISNFGVAIITTIIGVTGRVFFLQLRDTPQEIENDSLHGLHDSSRKLKMTLDNTIHDFSIFRTTLRQSMNEVHDEWRKSIEDQIKVITNFHNKSLEHYEQINQEILSKQEGILERLDSIIEQYDKVNIPEDVFIKKLEKPIDDFRFILATVAETIENKVQKINELQDSLINFSETETKFASIVNDIAKFSHDQISLSKKAMVDMINYQDSFRLSIETASDHFEEAKNGAISSIQKVDSLFGNLSEGIRSKSERVLENYSAVTETATKANSEISNLLDRQNHLIEKSLMKDLEEYSQALKAKIEEISSISITFEALIEQEVKLSKLIETSTKQADYSINGFNILGKRINDSVHQISNELKIGIEKQSNLLENLPSVAEDIKKNQKQQIQLLYHLANKGGIFKKVQKRIVGTDERQ